MCVRFQDMTEVFWTTCILPHNQGPLKTNDCERVWHHLLHKNLPIAFMYSSKFSLEASLYFLPRNASTIFFYELTTISINTVTRTTATRQLDSGTNVWIKMPAGVKWSEHNSPYLANVFVGVNETVVRDNNWVCWWCYKY